MTDLYRMNGGITPLGILVSHSWHEIGAILHTIDTYGVDLIIEIGVHRGGLASLLFAKCFLTDRLDYTGFEIDKDIVDEKVKRYLGPTLIIGDVFDFVPAIEQMMRGYQAPLIYCDGGDKPREFKVFSEVLQHGLIMVHDYRSEFNETHFKDTKLERIDADFLKTTRQVLFKKGIVMPRPVPYPVENGDAEVLPKNTDIPEQHVQSKQSKQSR